MLYLIDIKYNNMHVQGGEQLKKQPFIVNKFAMTVFDDSNDFISSVNYSQKGEILYIYHNVTCHFHEVQSFS